MAIHTFEGLAEHKLEILESFELVLLDLAEVVVAHVLPEVLEAVVVQVRGKEGCLVVRVISDLELLPREFKLFGGCFIKSTSARGPGC